ncbi:hypothetical protein STEG23_028157 [Scotinomys teguina]
MFRRSQLKSSYRYNKHSFSKPSLQVPCSYFSQSNVMRSSSVYQNKLLRKEKEKSGNVKSKFQKATSNKNQFLRLPASENSIQKAVKTEIQAINTMHVTDVTSYPYVVFAAVED